MLEKLGLLINSLPIILFYGVILFLIILFIKDKYQNQHSILRTHPLIGRFRYIFEMIGPELRQYWFLGDKQGRPVDRDTQETIAKAGKYGSTVMGFGSKRDFSKSGFYLANSLFPKNVEELQVKQSPRVQTYTYEIVEEGLLSRSEKRHQKDLNPWMLTDENSIIIGGKREHPFTVRGLVGVSAMSYGALSKSAIEALAQGVAISGSSFMNTGEGGISPYHLTKIYEANADAKKLIGRQQKIYDYIVDHPNISQSELIKRCGVSVNTMLEEMTKAEIITEKSADLIFQVGSGLFGARKNGVYDENVFLGNALKKEVKAIEIKLAQGAKVRGGKLPKEKITPEIAAIRGVEMGKDVESPNRFPLFSNMEELFDLICHWQKITGKPVGIKVVAGSEYSFDEMAQYIASTGKHPDFITIDGGEGGTGATYQEMADSLGLPIYSGLQILHQTLKKHGVRQDIKIIASGMLATADKMAIALSLGADMIYVARAAMNTIGCINAAKCHTNHCPVGITSHLPHLEAGLAVSEKRFRTANYLITMRQGLFMLGASCGIESPTMFEGKHVTFKGANSDTQNYG